MITYNDIFKKEELNRPALKVTSSLFLHVHIPHQAVFIARRFFLFFVRSFSLFEGDDIRRSKGSQHQAGFHGAEGCASEV